MRTAAGKASQPRGIAERDSRHVPSIVVKRTSRIAQIIAKRLCVMWRPSARTNPRTSMALPLPCSLVWHRQPSYGRGTRMNRRYLRCAARRRDWKPRPGPRQQKIPPSRSAKPLSALTSTRLWLGSRTASCCRGSLARASAASSAGMMLGTLRSEGPYSASCGGCVWIFNFCPRSRRT